MSLRHQYQYPPVGGLASSSRSTYPTFIPVQDTLYIQISCACRGLFGAFRWNLVASTIAGDAEIRANVLKSLMLNSVSLISIYTFDLLMLPLTRNQQRWLHRNVGWFYQVLWLLPVVGLSFYLNSSWCAVIAKRTYTLQFGNRATAQPQTITYTGLLTSLATSAYRVVMVLTSVVVSFTLGALPMVGPFLRFLFFCWVNSYYFFEFIWIARGYSLSRRIRYLEERWAYYLGFGLPSAALCTWGSSLAGAAVFALIFPAYVILAMHAHPVPQDPYNPVPPMADETVRYPSPFVPIRLPVFAIVVWLNDLIVWVLSVGGGRRRGGGRPPARHSRTLSDWVEGVEEGDGMETSSVQGHWREMTVGRGNRSNVGGGIRAVGAGKSGRRRGE